MFPPRFLLTVLPMLSVLHCAGKAWAYDVVATFARPGEQPAGRLVMAADGNFYGTTVTGGAHGLGTVFRVTPGGALSTVVSFTGTGGEAPGGNPEAGLTEAADGSLWGTAFTGGAGDFGTVFRVTPAGVFTPVLAFTGTAGAARGSVPGPLVRLADGNFYGTTQAGGTAGLGTVFRLTPAGALTTLVEFTGTSGSRKGAAPVGALTANGTTLYGVTRNGGGADLGTVWRVNTDGSNWSSLADFSGTAGTHRGSLPAAGLLWRTAENALFGTTERGGANDIGTVFKITPGGTFTSLRSFADTDGAQPAGTLITGADGALYGTTAGGGVSGLGSVFRITVTGTFSSLTSFSGTDGSALGAVPRSGLVTGNDGAFYGTVTAGGPGNPGLVYRVTTTGTCTPLAVFVSETGWFPTGTPLLLASGDFLYPMARGGPGGSGTVVRLTPAGVTVPEGALENALTGDTPDGGLVPDGAGFLGVTQRGGAADRGTCYRYTPGAGLSLVNSFTTSAGVMASGPLTDGGDGNFYGLAREGGISNRGTLFRIAPDGTRTRQVSFTGTTGAAPGNSPQGALALDPLTGRLLGLSRLGGSADSGVAFSFDPAGTGYSLLTTFSATGPRSPVSGLHAAQDGNFYATTPDGGAADAGTVIRLTRDGTLTVIGEFTGTAGALPGSAPAGRLTEAIDGTLYGMTTGGGAAGAGTVFCIPPGSAPELVVEFTGDSGAAPGAGSTGAPLATGPVGGLVFGADGGMYGVAPGGGPGGGGVAFCLTEAGPHVVTDDPLALTAGGAVLAGRVQNGGSAAAVVFDYGATPALGSTAPATPTGTADTVTRFSTALQGLTPGQTVYYRARATNASGTDTGDLRSATLPASALQTWKETELGDATLSDLADPDHDGLPLLIEYALVLSPTAKDAASGVDAAPVSEPDGLHLSCQLQRDPSRNDITITVQAASALGGPWEVLAESVQGAPFAGPGYVSGETPGPGVKSVGIRDPFTPATAIKRFVRVSVTR